MITRPNKLIKQPITLLHSERYNLKVNILSLVFAQMQCGCSKILDSGHRPGYILLIMLGAGRYVTYWQSGP